MRSVLVLAAFASLFNTAAWAQSGTSEPAPAWPKEPSAFLGIDIEGNFMEQVPTCPALPASPASLCRVATATADRFEVRGLPYLPISPGYELVVVAPNGKIKELVFSGNANSLYLVSEMLTEDFGEPGERTNRWVKLSSGASYQTEVYKWQGQKVGMRFQRQENDLGRYAVTVSTLAGEDVIADDDVDTRSVPSEITTNSQDESTSTL
ncbi:hypothetical protein [Pseudomonas sp. SK2]|uniref:hypothetical protein n=1 Tax=Pseudomonas sp. SK2 TaxID=2841063 RepID=UPI00192ADF5C|nr:hypothetical protein [Pseudomonas sp. SK2]QQZ34547.1 hypothetical protein IF103_14910 [Pseudomonas sp. SK2]